MTLSNLINSLSSRDIIILFVILMIVALLIANCCKINKFISSENKDRDNFVRDGSQRVEKLDESVSITKTANNTASATVTMYYTQWCGYSKIFMPEWKIVKDKISRELGDSVAFEEYDCDAVKEKCYNDGINGYPSVTLRKQDGSIINYPDNYPRTADLVVDFIKKNIK